MAEAEPQTGDHRMAHDGRPVFVARQKPEQHCAARAAMAHDHAALLFYTGGSVKMEQRGTWSVRAGDVLLVPAGEPHRILERERPESWGVGFRVSGFVAEDVVALVEPFERVRAGGAAVVQVPAARHGFLESLFGELRAEVSRPGERSLAVQRSLLTLILAEVRRAEVDRPRLDAPDSLVANSLRFIERRCLGPLSLGEVAAAVHRSPAHVTTMLKRATGKSVVEWIIAGRLAEARRRLLHSDERVEIIAERVGYADPTHFIRLFRRASGLTPSAWRAQQRGESA